MAAVLVAACGGQPPSPQPMVLVSVSGTGNANESLDSPGKNGWDLRWAYDCSATGGRGVFFVDVFESDHTPDFKAPGVSEEGDRDSGDYHVPSSGRFYLEITTTCSWTVEAVERS